jgi:CRISPR/Cas system-associated endonuclease Cas1
VLKSGNMVSTGLLTALGFWEIDVLVTTRNDRPIAILKNLEDNSPVASRIAQYEALNSGKGITVAKRIVYIKALGENEVLRKYRLRQLDIMGIKRAIEKESGNLAQVRQRLTTIESHYSKKYFCEIF